MARKTPETYTPWRVDGVTLGFLRSGIHWIDRTIHGRRYRVSTGCRTPEAALGEYRRFEKDPPRYVPRGKVGTDWDLAVQAFLRWSEHVKHNSKRHVDKQEAHLANFGAFTRGGSRVFVSLDSFSGSDINAFMEKLTKGEITGRAVGPPSFNRYLASLKAFMRWARDVEKYTTNRADEEVLMVREDKDVDLPKEIPESAWKIILKHLDERWRCVAEIQLGAGLRYGEVAQLSSGNILPHAIHIPIAKGKRGRTIPASKRTVEAARTLLKLGGVPDDEASQFDHRLEYACRQAGVPGFTSHRFRHTYGTVTLRALLRAGQGLVELKARLGHKSIKTTEKYLHAINATDGGRRVVVGAPL